MFLPETYEVPQAGGNGRYFRPQKGESKVRILTDCILGWVYWNNQDKPVRLPLDQRPNGNPSDLRIKDGKPERIRHFWALLVYDYGSGNIAIWEITQGTIQDAIAAYAKDADWGHPRGYDLKISREGEGLETKYTVIASPQKPPSQEIIKAYTETPVDLMALYRGEDPFSADHHSHSMDMSTADAVAAMVAQAKAEKLDVRGLCESNGLPLKVSEYTPEQMLKLEDALAECRQNQPDPDDIPF